MGFRHFRRGGFARAHRYYTLARDASREAGEADRVEILDIMLEMTTAVLDGVALGRLADRFGESRGTILGEAGFSERVKGSLQRGAADRFREVRELPERRLLHAWLPRCLPLEPEGSICQGRASAFPSHLELMYQYAMRWVPPALR